MKRSTMCVLWPWLLLACGASPVESAKVPDPIASARPTPGPLRRAELTHVIDQGLGALLAHVEVAPMQREGRFLGFAIQRFVCTEAADCDVGPARLGLRVGDILLQVGGKPIATPDEAQLAFESLRDAPEIRLEVERENVRRTLTTPIAP